MTSIDGDPDDVGISYFPNTPFFIQFEKVTIQLEKLVIPFEILVNQFEKDRVPFEIIRIQFEKDEI